MNVAVILAGGSGERFWPLSRQNKPKQLLPITSSSTMLKETVSRINLYIPLEHIFIVAGKNIVPTIKQELGHLIPLNNIIKEPCGKNTAPGLMLALAHITQRFDTNTVVGVFPSDHFIRGEEFVADIENCYNYAAKSWNIVTIGIPPTSPETGFGYLEIGTKDYSKMENIFRAVFKFHEKPDLDTACTYFKSGNFLWNSGMFFGKVKVFAEAMIFHCPSMYKDYCDIQNHIDCSTLIEDVFNQLPSISIDNAFMEKYLNVCTLIGRFDWNDLGTLSALEKVKEADENDNIVKGNVCAVDTEGCIILNDPFRPKSDYLVAALGVQDLIIVHDKDVFLVCAKSREHEIKNLLKKMREENKEKFL